MESEVSPFRQGRPDSRSRRQRFRHNRSREKRRGLPVFCSFLSPSVSARIPASARCSVPMGWVSTSVNSPWKHPHRCAQRCNVWVVLNLAKLARKEASCHSIPSCLALPWKQPRCEQATDCQASAWWSMEQGKLFTQGELNWAGTICWFSNEDQTLSGIVCFLLPKETFHTVQAGRKTTQAQESRWGDRGFVGWNIARLRVSLTGTMLAHSFATPECMPRFCSLFCLGNALHDRSVRNFKSLFSTMSRLWLMLLLMNRFLMWWFKWECPHRFRHFTAQFPAGGTVLEGWRGLALWRTSVPQRGALRSQSLARHLLFLLHAWVWRCELSASTSPLHACPWLLCLPAEMDSSCSGAKAQNKLFLL